MLLFSVTNMGMFPSTRIKSLSMVVAFPLNPPLSSLHGSYRLHLSRLFSSASSTNDEMQDLITKEKNDQETMTAKHKVTWRTKTSAAAEDSGDIQTLTFDVYSGETLRTAALRRNVVSPHNGRANLINCRGLGTCGTCAVEITPKENIEPRERNQMEQLRFNFPPHSFHNNTKLRLACQIQVRGDIEVTKRTGFWGQREEVASASNPQHYFGELEYLLDRKSPDVTERGQGKDEANNEQ